MEVKNQYERFNLDEKKKILLEEKSKFNDCIYEQTSSTTTIASISKKEGRKERQIDKKKETKKAWSYIK